MKYYRTLDRLFIVFFLCTAMSGIGLAGTGLNDSISSSKENGLAKQTSNVKLGFKLLMGGRSKEAINQYFNPTLAYFGNKYSSTKTRYQCARSQQERLHYLLLATMQKDKKYTSTKIVSNLWCSALFGKGYALINMKKWSKAHAEMAALVGMAPQNSYYLSELGHIFHAKKQWKKALKVFEKAEQAVAFTPARLKKAELSRAIRGIGYSLIELGQLNKAREHFNRCLKINPNDRKARNELRYISKLEQKQRGI